LPNSKQFFAVTLAVSSYVVAVWTLRGSQQLTGFSVSKIY
jgi:hypothetical protein